MFIKADLTNELQKDIEAKSGVDCFIGSLGKDGNMPIRVSEYEVKSIFGRETPVELT